MFLWLVNNSLLAVLVLTFGGMLLFMLLESCKNSDGLNDTGRLLSNWGLGLINFFVGMFLSALILLPALHDLPAAFHLDALPPLVEFLLIVLIFEAISYWLHRAFHHVRYLWRLHAVHHLDTRLDVTTSHRHHLGEAIITTCVLVPVALLLGVSAQVWLLFALVRIVVVLWSHSRLTLPAAIERVVGWMIVTPGFHRNHHASEQQLTNSNYGTLVPWYDYLFGTATAPARGYQIGLEYLRDPASSRIDRLLLLPFRWQHRSDARDTTRPRATTIKHAKPR
ncbi:sterol desaturase family protein [Halopseudomonas salegens]|uniref:Sterol desaturase/sphingolipid hydroxylase, fatty acid hydroxylase superfamily n=1 Tax=Halopseudomonas salegens TaxID=1434072 RepID=A0A1H2FND1_9GAMM|nr:sterol desaturase family protein [Halopseudomonas salegens]SDU08873.1 Sterol desaturase/sphingolipid hydroxylase, fatty acid hydroxylase superfamily [Halopseudomonas salegens]